MDDMFNTGWDPHEELLLARHNINELARGLAHSTETLKQLVERYNHQQVIIEQLTQQNQRLNELVKNTRHEVARLGADMYSIKNNLN